MRKRVKGSPLGRKSNTRDALYFSLMRGLIKNGAIVTTRQKAKALIPRVDRLMRYVAENSIAARRRVLSKVRNDRGLAEELFARKALTKSRKSGFTKLEALPSRRGDNARMVSLSWVEEDTSEQNKENENIPTEGK